MKRDQVAGCIGGSSRRRTASRPANRTRPRTRDEMFQMAQWARGSEAAASLAQMAARGATGNAALAATRPRAAGPGRRLAEAGCGAQCRPCRSLPTSATNRQRLPTLPNLVRSTRASLRSTSTLAENFPDYAALASAKPLSIPDVQSQLRDGEALVLFLDTPELGADAGGNFYLGCDQDATAGG